MKFVFIHPSGGNYWKAKQRYSILQRTLHTRYNLKADILDSVSFKGKTSDTGMLCGDADVVFLHVQACKDAAQVIQHWQARDKIVILDVPVPMVLDPFTNKFMIGQSTAPLVGCVEEPSASIDRDQLFWIIKLVDGVLVNSRQLLEDWSGIGRVIFQPDYLDSDQYLIHPYEAHDGIHLGVRVGEGGIQKLKDSGLLPAIEAIGNRFPQTRMVFKGIQPELAPEIHLPSHQKIIIPCNESSKWMAVLPSLDIGVLPKLTAFDQRSGREEILEFMLMKVPWVASSGVCCRELGQYGWLVQNKTGTWERILDDMINNLDNYRAESAEGFLFALGQSIDENIDKFMAACYSLKAEIFSGVV